MKILNIDFPFSLLGKVGMARNDPTSTERSEVKICKMATHSTVKSYPPSSYWSSTRGSREFCAFSSAAISLNTEPKVQIYSELLYELSSSALLTLISHFRVFKYFQLTFSFYLFHIHPPWHNIPLFNRPHMRYHIICHSVNACINRSFDDLNCTIINF